MNKVKKYRIKRKMTQKELAIAIDVTSDYISQIERGRVPGMDTARKIADLFDTTIDDIFLSGGRTKGSETKK